MKVQILAYKYSWAAQLFTDVSIAFAAEPWDLLMRKTIWEAENNEFMVVIPTVCGFQTFKKKELSLLTMF